MKTLGFQVAGPGSASFAPTLLPAPTISVSSPAAIDLREAASPGFGVLDGPRVGARPALSPEQARAFAQRGFSYHDFSDPNVRLRECLRKGIPLDPVRPVHDYGPTGGILMDAHRPYDSIAMLQAVCKHTPASVPIFVVSPDVEDIRHADQVLEFGKRDEGAIHLIPIESRGSRTAISEWFRDHVGLFVTAKNGKQKLVRADYYHGEDMSTPLRGLFRAGEHHHIKEYIEFGNSVRIGGHIFLVDSDRMGDSEAADYIATGADHVHLLPWLTNAKGDKAGIGHADERIFPVDDRTALTDSPVYAEYLRACGMQVRMLPSLIDNESAPYCTYANALSVVTADEKIAFVPQFAVIGVDPSLDAAALKAYEAEGFRAIPYSAPLTAMAGRGGIHCQTVNLPQGLAQLERPNTYARPGAIKLN
ncbi:MAG: hypothetical protein AAF735_00215 [Myxococcota bacterium]